jgi:O-antigen ligase
MFYIYLAYLFLIPLEYLQYRFPKGPTAINYETLMMIGLTIWLFTGRPGAGGKEGPRFTASPLNKVLTFTLVFIYLGMIITYFQFPLQQTNPFDPNALALKRFTYIYTGFLMFWLASNMLDSRRKIRWAMLAMALASPLVVRAFRSDLSGVSAWHYSDDMRVKGPFMSIGSNELGAFFVFGSIMLLMNALATTNWKERLLYAGGGCGYVYGILYSYSRSTQLAFGIAVGLIAMMRHRWVIILIVLAAMTSKAWLPQSVVDRWEMTTNAEGELDESAANRKIFWQLAIEYFESSPVVGQGFGSFPLMNPAKMDTHNIYYRTLAEQGLVGVILFGMMWFYLIKLGYELMKGGACRFDRAYGTALMIATVGLAVTNYFGDRFTHLALIGQYWTFVGIGARLRSHMRGEELLADEPLRPEEIEDGKGEIPMGASGGLALPGDGGLQPAYTQARIMTQVGNGARGGVTRLLREKALPGRPKLRLVGAEKLNQAPTLTNQQALSSQHRNQSAAGAKRPMLNLVGKPQPPKAHSRQAAPGS